MISFKADGIEYRFFDHLYAVSRCGKVLRKLMPWDPIIRGDGYVTLGRLRLMHRVVAHCWIENPTNAKLVHHKNEIKTDNRADNLEWGTASQNKQDYLYAQLQEKEEKWNAIVTSSGSERGW